MIRALQLAPAAVIQPFSYTLLLWAVIIGSAGFAELPDRWTLVGAAAIGGAGVDTAAGAALAQASLIGLPAGRALERGPSAECPDVATTDTPRAGHDHR
jgi:drug/metabolite transporter (DMT)-like permease